MAALDKNIPNSNEDPTNCHSWLENVIFVGKTTLGTGIFGLLIIYLALPKPYLASQFATLSLARGLPGQSQSEVKKEKQGSRLEDVRQQSTIGTAVETEASGSLLIPEEVRRTSSSAVSIQRRESNEPESSTSSWQDPRPFPLGKIKEQEIAPQVQEMTTRVAGSSTGNTTSFGERKEMTTGKNRLIHRPVQPPATARSPRGQALQSSLSDPETFNQSESQSSRRRCSPCSENIFSCCQTTFNSLRRPQTLSISGPAPTVSAQRIAPLRSARTTQSSTLEWDDRLTDDLVQEYFSKPTQDERERFYDECEKKTNPSKMIRVHDSIDHQDTYQLQRANSIALARAAAIDQHINNSNSHLLNDTIPAEGFPEATSREYRAPNYHENLPWQLRLVPNDASQIQPTDIDSYFNMRSHTADITMDQATSQRKQVEKCPQHLRRSQERGRKRLLEVAIKNGNIRTLPVGRDENQNVNNIVAILRHTPQCKFSADKNIATLVERAYQILGWDWPNLENTPISSSLPPNLFSIGQNNVAMGTGNPAGIDWVSTTIGGKKRKTWSLKVMTASIEYEGGKVAEMILVSPDHLHVDKHYEAYDDDGNYLGKMDKDTMLLYAESIPYEDRIALPKKDVK
jgi:hypothetical protein